MGTISHYAGAGRHKNLVIDCMRVVVSLVSLFNMIVLSLTFRIISSQTSSAAVCAVPLLFDRFFRSRQISWSPNNFVRSNSISMSERSSCRRFDPLVDDDGPCM